MWGATFKVRTVFSAPFRHNKLKHVDEGKNFTLPCLLSLFFFSFLRAEEISDLLSESFSLAKFTAWVLG